MGYVKNIFRASLNVCHTKPLNIYNCGILEEFEKSNRGTTCTRDLTLSIAGRVIAKIWQSRRFKIKCHTL